MLRRRKSRTGEHGNPAGISKALPKLPKTYGCKLEMKNAAGAIRRPSNLFN
jgi:hypothetical protein